MFDKNEGSARGGLDLVLPRYHTAHCGVYLPCCVAKVLYCKNDIVLRILAFILLAVSSWGRVQVEI